MNTDTNRQKPAKVVVGRYVPSPTDEVPLGNRRTAVIDWWQARLPSRDLLNSCFCSRKDIQQVASAPHCRGSVYTGVCARLSIEQPPQKRVLTQPALRLRVADLIVGCDDG